MDRIGYYAHHHGRGHLQRALLVARALPGWVEILSSLDHPEVDVPLPPDTSRTSPSLGGATVDGSGSVLHWAPRHEPLLAERATTIINWVRYNRPALVVVDVSVEVTLLLRLMGVPVVVVRQHGERVDAPHVAAYSTADSLLAPYPSWAEDPTATAAVRAKTYYAGAFSRFDDRPAPAGTRSTDEVLVMAGTGGTGLDAQYLARLADEVGGRWTVVGLVGPDRPGLRFLGSVHDPWPLLSTSGLLIASAGHSALSEAAAAGVPTIAVAERRPFGEQEHKVRVLAEQGVVHAAPPLGDVDAWVDTIERARDGQARWKDFVDRGALHRTVEHLQGLTLEFSRGVAGHEDGTVVA